MSHRPALPPHLADEEVEANREKYALKRGSEIGPQGASKYGPGGRRVAKAKGRKKK